MKKLTIRYHQEAEGWWADSPDLPGWTAVGGTFEELRALAVEGARRFAGSVVELSEELPPYDGRAAEG